MPTVLLKVFVENGPVLPHLGDISGWARVNKWKLVQLVKLRQQSDTLSNWVELSSTSLKKKKKKLLISLILAIVLSKIMNNNS